MTTAWFVDALDARAGLAFASFRAPDLAADLPDTNALAVYIAPPDFRPETLSSRAAGLAATRASFQTGLFLEESEIGFPVLDDLIEFVRRLYVAGGGGDGAGGTGGGVAPPPDPGRGEGPGEGLIEGEEETGFSTGIGLLVEAFAKAADGAGFEWTAGAESASATDGMWRVTGASPEYHADAGLSADPGPALAEAAARLAAELVARCPQKGDDEGLASWWAALRSLTAAISRQRLWEDLAAPRPRRLLAEAGRTLLDGRQALFPDYLAPDFDPEAGMDEAERFIFVFWLLTGWIDGWALSRMLENPETWPDFIDYYAREHYRGAESDRYEELGRWPLSDPICGRTGLPRHSASLADLLCLATASPISTRDCHASEAGLLLFAAMHVVPASHVPAGWRRGAPLRKAWRRALAKRALVWLARQFPQRAFGFEIEQLLNRSPWRQYV